ncbi:MAG: hypothetical protein AB7T17_08790 [Geobacter sp.]
MTVGQMIKKLSKYPKSVKVAMLDHDQSGEFENGDLSWNGPVFAVDEAPDGVKQRGYGVIIR